MQLLKKNKYPLRGRDLFWICWEVRIACAQAGECIVDNCDLCLTPILKVMPCSQQQPDVLMLMRLQREKTLVKRNAFVYGELFFVLQHILSFCLCVCACLRVCSHVSSCFPRVWDRTFDQSTNSFETAYLQASGSSSPTSWLLSRRRCSCAPTSRPTLPPAATSVSVLWFG